MKKAIPIILLFVCSSAIAYSSTDPNYDSAFAEMKAMLEGKIPLSFKRAVFITENAYMDNQLNYENFNNEIRVLKILAMSIIKNDVLIYDSPDKEIIEKSGAIYKVLKGETEFVIRHDTTISTFKWTPYEYDMNDFWGHKNWINNFVTKALVTHSGNCHSLPLLYKILAEELDVPAYLSIAPNHTYIKQWSDKTGWYNTELTNGSFPYDKDIKWNSYVKTEAIANGIYMDTLSNKQSIAYAITDLAQGYVRKYGYEDSQTPLIWLNTALAYYPNYVNALILKAELQKRQFEKQMSSQGHTKLGEALQVPALAKAVNQLGKSYFHIYQLGYRRMPKEMYLNWLFRVKNDSTREPHTFKTPQPFKDYGYKVHVATAGNGENYEFYDQDTTTRIGTVEINRLTGEIVRFVSYNFEDEMPDEVISRMYDPALGRFWQVDPLTDIAEDRTPYHFTSNNPINRIDPTGLTDFKINKETGEVTQVGEANDKPDQIVRTDKDGNVKRKGEGFLGSLVRDKNKGKAKVAYGGIKQGFLKDGMNLKYEDNVFEVGGHDQPTKDDFEDFALKVSNYVDKEIDGFYLSKKGESNISHIYFAGYKNNDEQNARGSFRLDIVRPDLFGKTEAKVAFHTHLSRFGDSDRLRPSYLGSSGGDIGFKKRQTRFNPNLKFLIITNPKSFEY